MQLNTPSQHSATALHTSSPRLADVWRSTWRRVSASPWTLDMLALVQRVAIAAIFFLSGRTKVDGLFTLNDSALTLFQEDYKLPVIPPEAAAWLAAGAEHLFPVLLVLGLATRLSAIALLGMTLVIQVFVYPDAWPTHLSWAGLLMALTVYGAGRASVDHWIGKRAGA
jgi:putative oxidoreductase